MKWYHWIITIIISTTIALLINYKSEQIASTWPQQKVENIYTPEDFKENYAIDLKQDGYLIVDIHDGECYYVPFGQLEDWFLEMNL